MYTPEEIRSIEFTKSLGGYKTSEVDVFIDRCADTVAALMNEKEELAKKLEVLADKLVEYRNEEDSIRTALLSAQRLGDTVVREANHKAGLILEDANIKAEKVLDTAKRNIKEEEEELARIQREVANFKSRMLSIYREHLSLIDILPEMPEENTAEDKSETVTAEKGMPSSVPEAAQEPKKEAAEMPVVESIMPQPAFEPVEAAVKMPAVQPKREEPTYVMNIPELKEEDVVPAVVPAAKPQETAGSTSSSSRFGDLKFGEGYDISRDDRDGKGFFKRKK